MKLEIELSDDVARSLSVIASDKNLGMDTLASIVVCNYVVSRPTKRALDLRPCGHKWESTLMNSLTGEMSCAECASQ